MDLAIRNHAFGLGAVVFHMWRYGVGTKRLHALPLFNNYKCIWPEFGLHGACILGVGCRFVCDAALFRFDRGDVLVEQVQKGCALARFGFDYRDNVDVRHGWCSPFYRGSSC